MVWSFQAASSGPSATEDLICQVSVAGLAYQPPVEPEGREMQVDAQEEERLSSARAAGLLSFHPNVVGLL